MKVAQGGGNCGISGIMDTFGDEVFGGFAEGTLRYEALRSAFKNLVIGIGFITVHGGSHALAGRTAWRE